MPCYRFINIFVSFAVSFAVSFPVPSGKGGPCIEAPRTHVEEAITFHLVRDVFDRRYPSTGV
jgi:hypothetical protein